MDKQQEDFAPDEIERRFQATLRRMLTTPRPKKVTKVTRGSRVALPEVPTANRSKRQDRNTGK